MKYNSFIFILLAISILFASCEEISPLFDETTVESEPRPSSETTVRTHETTSGPGRGSEWFRVAPVYDQDYPTLRLQYDVIIPDLVEGFETIVYLYDPMTDKGELLVWDILFEHNTVFENGAQAYNGRYYTEAPDLYRYEMTSLDWIYGEPIPPGTLTPIEQAPAVYRRDDGELRTVANGWWRNWLRDVTHPFGDEVTVSPVGYKLTRPQYTPREELVPGERCVYIGYVDREFNWLAVTGGSESQMNEKFLGLIAKAEEMRDLTFGTAPD